MLLATEQERRDVIDYFRSQARDLSVVLAQKVYSENVLHVSHDVWDIHTDKDRWWVITGGLMNLYSQEQFPNLDLAVTFHVGLCLRIPRSERQKLESFPVEPFAEPYRHLAEVSDALDHAQEVTDYQAIGVRCREALLTFVSVAQKVVPWSGTGDPPKKADFKSWAEHICDAVLSGATNEHRRHLLKVLMESAWKFVNWLTHAKGSRWHDAEAAVEVTEQTITLAVSAALMHMRGVPDKCPACGSQRLSPERGYRTDMPDVEWERPTCDKCGWAGEPVEIKRVVAPAEPRDPPKGDCVIPTVPLVSLVRPRN